MITNHQLLNLRQYSGIVSITKPQFLQPIKGIKDWASIATNGGIDQLYYHANHQHWEAYRFIESIDRSIRTEIILTIYGDRRSFSYRWCRPNIDAIVEERNFDLLTNFLNQDVPIIRSQWR
jgi:hypothetical protein